MKKNFLVLTVMFLPIIFSGCGLLDTNIPNESLNESWNPASIYCEQNWGTLEIVPDEWWQWAKCNFDDWSFCEEWAYFHGECSPNWWNGNAVDLQDIENNDEISDEEKEEIVDFVEENVEESEVTCTQDVKKCEDWTYVSRWWPNCEFSACPWSQLSNEMVQNLLNQYKTSWSGLAEDDIDLMNEIIDVMTQI